MSHPVLTIPALVSSNQKRNKGRKVPLQYTTVNYTYFSLKFSLLDTYDSTLTWLFILFSGHSISGTSSSAYSLNTSAPQTSILEEMYPFLSSLLNFSIPF